MNPSKLIKFAVTGFGLALTLTGCGSSTDGSGTGGSSSTGGATGSGGATGNATGGTTGTGGTTSTGGITGTGGINGTGGTAGAAGHPAGGGGTAGAAGHPAGGGGTAGTAGHPPGGASGSSGAGGSAGTTGGLTLTSPDQADGVAFASMFTCAATGMLGTGINPELDWSGAPAGTMSFAITFIDTKLGANMATGQHWAIWDIPATASEFPKGTTMLTGALTGAMQTNKYLAPCPSGNDTYAYTLYALSSATLNVTGASGSGTANSAGVAKVLTALAAVTPLATATLHGTAPPLYGM
jgi:phosphatidylethanolamine-binding protein (PEBP) family uncharacterized protein